MKKKKRTFRRVDWTKVLGLKKTAKKCQDAADALVWARQFHSLTLAWNTCPNLNWMIWLLNEAGYHPYLEPIGALLISAEAVRELFPNPPVIKPSRGGLFGFRR